MALLNTRALRKAYGALVAVESLDLELAEGEFFGLLGPNGAGKTTSISMISGAVTMDSGEVTIHGTDLRANGRAAKGHLGLVPQEIAVYDDLTGRENLEYFASCQGLRGAERREAVDRGLRLAGLEDRAKEPVKKYSGGMKRRLNLAAGVLHRPKLLICDEPTVGVDAQSRARIFEALKSLQSNDGMSILYTSHYMEEVEALCTRVGIMDRARLIALDTIPALIAQHAHEGGEIEVVGDAARLRAELPGSAPVNDQAQRLRVPQGMTIQEVAAAIERVGGRLLSYRASAANLETVFLNLTGKGLRDAS